LTSRRQLANQSNAQFSTGPVTPAGKRRSAKNATTHGLSSQRESAPLDPDTLNKLTKALIGSSDDVIQMAAAREVVDAIAYLGSVEAAKNNILSSLELENLQLCARKFKVIIRYERAATACVRRAIRGFRDLRG